MRKSKLGGELMIRFATTIAATIVLTGCEFGDVGPSDRYQTDFHYTYDLAPGGKINAESFNGSIEISGWDQGKVEITGAKYGATETLRDNVKLDVHNAADSVEIRASRGSATNGGCGARIVMHVPRTALLDRITTSNGAIKIRDVAGAPHLKTSNGSITASNIASDVDAHTSNGPIDVEQVKGGALLKTSNGHIRVEGVNGPLEVETSNGPITARSASDTSAKLTSSNGAIDLTLDRAPKGDIKAATHNGGIKLHLPAGSAAHLIADTSRGSISSDFDMASSGNGEDNRKHVDANIGSGGPTIELTTSNSSIQVVKGTGGN